MGAREQDSVLRALVKDLTAENWTIAFNELITDRVVGRSALKFGTIISPTYPNSLCNRGASGTVHLGNWRGIKVAIKILNTTSLDATELDEFIGEVAMLRRVHHPHVVQLIGAVVEVTIIPLVFSSHNITKIDRLPLHQAPNFALVTEFLDKGSLLDVLEDESLHFDWKMKLKFANEAALGLYYLHSFDTPIIHRDVKVRNISNQND